MLPAFCGARRNNKHQLRLMGPRNLGKAGRQSDDVCITALESPLSLVTRVRSDAEKGGFMLARLKNETEVFFSVCLTLK